MTSVSLTGGFVGEVSSTPPPLRFQIRLSLPPISPKQTKKYHAGGIYYGMILRRWIAIIVAGRGGREDGRDGVEEKALRTADIPPLFMCTFLHTQSVRSTRPMSVAARRAVVAPPIATSSLPGRSGGGGSHGTAAPGRRAAGAFFSASAGGRGAGQERFASTNKGAPSLAARLLNQSSAYNTSAHSGAKAKAKAAAKVDADGPASGPAPAASDPAPAGQADKSKEAKRKALDRVLGEIDSNFGKGSIMKLGTALQAKVATFPSGAMTLDIALGGGIPRGRIVEIYGPESSGKTTLALHSMAEMQKLGGTVALIDAEHAFDPEYSARLGLDIDEVRLKISAEFHRQRDLQREVELHLNGGGWVGRKIKNVTSLP